MSIIARLGVWLGINTSEFVKGLDEATKKSKEFEQKQKEAFKRSKKEAEELSAAFTKISFAIGAVGVAIVDTFKKADEISDIAKGFDTTIESLIATQSALQGAGGNAEDVATMFQKLAQAQDGAREGNDALRESFARLGIVGGQVDSLKLDALFKEVAKALSQVDDASERAALAQDLLGKAVKGVNWADFVEKYKEFDDPKLVKAIEDNAQAWEDIEKAMKNISLLMQQIAAPIARMANDSFEIAKNFKDAEAHQYGIASIFQLMFAPKTVKLLPKPKKEITDIFEALPPENADTPMLYGQGGYSKKSEKELAAAKKAAEDAKKIQEARASLELEISLIKQKADISERMFAVNSKGVILGEKAVSQEKMMLDLANDIAEIRNAAAKERSKDKAQIDLINAKEKEQIDARVRQFGFENGLRMQQREREHQLAIQAIQDEGVLKRDALSIQIFNEHELLDVEKQRFELGNSAYQLLKQDIETQNKLREIRNKYLEDSKAINKEFDNSAKSAEDLEIFETKIEELKRNQAAQILLIVGVEKRRKDVLEQQIAIEEKLFKLDLAQQEGRQIANIQAELSINKDRLGLEYRRYMLSQNEYNMQNLQLDNIGRLIEAEKKYADQKTEAYYEMQRQGGGDKAREQYEQRIKSIEKVRDIELDAIEQVNDLRTRNAEAEVARQKSFVEGWEYSARRFYEESENAFNRGQQAFSSVMGNMDAAISNFVETGKFKFKDFAASVIKDLIRIQLRAQATMLFRMVLGSIGGVPMSAPNYDAGIGGNVGLAATGGEIDGPTIVGENGPELFVPSQRGTVIPNTIAPSMAGMNQPQVVYNGPYIENMSAIDTQSAAQFLSKNKMSVWAANKSADRSVPVSR